MFNIRTTSNNTTHTPEQIQEALHSALDVVALDGAAWRAGRDAFQEAQVNQTLEESVAAALNAAAPDEGSRDAGREKFYDILGTNKKSKPRKRLRFPSQAYSQKQIARRS